MSDDAPVTRLHRFHEVERRQVGDDFIRGTHTTLHTIRWPTLVGGPLNGEAAPPAFVDGTMKTQAVEVAHVEGSAEDPQPPSTGRYDVLLYIEHPLQVHAGSKTLLRVRVEALIWEQMPVAAATTYVLLTAFGVPGVRP